MKSFVHLHNHTEYSLLDGVSRFAPNKKGPSEMMKTVAQWGMPAMAITDHGNIFGSVEFYLACREVGVKPILGQTPREDGWATRVHMPLL